MSNTRPSKAMLDGIMVYYDRLKSLMDSVGKYNEVCGIYNKRNRLLNGKWVPSKVQAVFDKTYHGSIKELDNAFGQCDSTVQRKLLMVGEALDVLQIPYTASELRNLEMMIRSTTGETKFRAVVGRYVEAMKKEVEKGIELQKAGVEIEPLSVESPTDLIRYYQATPEERREIKSSKRVKKVKPPKKPRKTKATQ
ncbi:MAG: hypothetical protein K6F57_01975 [Candidatus Saccharibacteria bacterium]|nr:hypothetical protein [Candidatus Saccharibacteria bacterium]